MRLIRRLIRKALPMKLQCVVRKCCWLVIFFCCVQLPVHRGLAADKLVGFQSARTMSQAMPWIADEVGLFKKYDLDFQLVYISSAQLVTAAIPSGDGQIAISGGEGAGCGLR